jgi:hypothetical protein
MVGPIPILSFEDNVVYEEDYLATLYENERLYKLTVFPPDFQRTIKLERFKGLFKRLLQSCIKHGISLDIFMLATYLIYKLLSFVRIPRKKLDLVGVTLLYTATKIISNTEYLPISYLTQSDDWFTKEDIYATEKVILDKLQWNIYPPTPMDFIHRYCEYNVITTCDNTTIATLLALIIGTDIIVRYFPSTIAYAALLVAYSVYQTDTMNFNENYQTTLDYLNSIIDNATEDDLLLCRDELIMLYNNTDDETLRLVKLYTR